MAENGVYRGSHVAEHCLRLDMEVVGLDDLSGGFTENVPRGVTFVRGSVTDAKLVEQQIPWGE